MCDLMYASSPSWYCTKAVDADEKGFLYFVANYNLYVLDLTSSPPRYILHLHAHHQRAVGISVCQLPGQWSCCTIGEDGRVKIWDLVSKICVEEHSTHKNPLTCVHWSPIDKNIIATSDSKGGIVVWHVSTSEFSFFSPENSHVFALSCSPHNRELIAVGYKSSSIFILNINRGGQIIQKLRGHDEEIHGVCWCPSLGEDLQFRNQGQDLDKERSTSECLLASSSKDRTVRIWATSSGRSLLTLKLPSTSGARKDKAEDRVGGRIWVGLHWPSNKPRQLISSSFNGDMLLWDLCKPGKQKWNILSASKYAKGHSRLVFNIVTAGPEYNILSTSSMDRQITLWDMTSLKAKLNIPTLGGFGYCLALSPVNPGRLAVGAGDCLIRIWNINNPLNPFDTQVFWQGLRSKVTSVSWHPVKEGHLAYGTEDGRVGIYEIFSSRSPQISSTYHRGTVYNVTWGPPCVGHENYPVNTYHLYSCGDGRLLQHEPNHLDKEAIDINKHVREINKIKGKYPGHTEISFKHDFSAVAVGNDDGSIDLLRVPHLQRLCCIQVHRKLVNVIKWHPEYTADSTEPSIYRTWIATGSGESVVQVFDLTTVLEGGHGDSPCIVTESNCQLMGHSNRITQLSWSTFTQGMLASASYDHTVQVWDVKTCEPVANYRGHYGRLMCVQWSDLDKDVIYSGGQDNTVQCWNISKQQFVTPPVGNPDKLRKNKKKRNDSQLLQLSSVEGASLKDTELKQESLQEITELLELKKQELLASSPGNDGNTTCSLDNVATVASGEKISNNETEDAKSESLNKVETLRLQQTVADILGEDLVGKEEEEDHDESVTSPVTDVVLTKKEGSGKEKKKKKYRSLLPTSSLKDNRGKVFQHEDCVKLAEYIYKEKTESLGEELFHIGHFINRRSTFELINYEVEHHKLQGNVEQLAMLEIMKGNLNGVLKKAANEHHLNDWLVGLAPMGFSNFWKEICTNYVKQLEKDGFCHKAMSYLLAINKVYEAVDVLVRSSAYKDAICLAKLRLSPYDPKIKQIYMQWAEVLAKDSNLEMAAKCYIACNEPIEAAKCLVRRTDLSALKAAAQICVLANEIDSAKLYTHRLIQDCYVSFDWHTAQDIILCHDSFHNYALPVSCHEVLVQQLTKMQVLSSETISTAVPSSVERMKSNIKLPSFLMNDDDVCNLCPWPVWSVDGEMFSMKVLRLWVEKWNVMLHTQELAFLYCTLKDMKTEKHGLMQLHQLLVNITFDIVLGILQLLLGDCDQAANHWAVAIATCIDQHEKVVAEALCRLLLPQGAGAFTKVSQQIYALTVTETGTSPPVRKKSLTKKNENELSKNTNTVSISCNKFVCTPVDALKAYYSLIVLNHWLSAIKGTVVNHKVSTPDKSPGNRSNPSNSPRGSTKSGTTNSRKGAIGKENITGRNLSKEFTDTHNTCGDGSTLMSVLSLPAKCLSLSVAALCEVSQDLLWDIQAKKQRFEASLLYIQKAISDMISKHRDTASMHSGSVDANIETSSIGSINDINSPAKIGIKRAPSGEYIAMNKSNNGNRVLYKKKPHESIPLTPPAKGAPVLSMIKCKTHDEDEFVDMKAEVRECTKQCDSNIEGILDNQTDFEKTLSIDVDIASNKTMFTLGSPVLKNEQVDLDQDSSSSPKDKMSLSTTTVAYSNVPDEWFELPVDVKYQSDCVTLQLLTTEQQYIQDQLQQLNNNIKTNVFPAVLSSAADIVYVITEQNEGALAAAELVDHLSEWIGKHQYLTNHGDFCDTLKQLSNA